MNCQDVQYRIDDYAADRLEDATRRSIRIHLESCALCRDFLREEDAFRRMVAELPSATAPADFDERLRKALFRAPSRQSTPVVVFPWTRALLTAASLLLAVTLFWVAWPTLNPPSPGAAGPVARNGHPASDELVIPLPAGSQEGARQERVRFVTKDLNTGGDMYVEMPARYSLNDFQQMESYYLQEVSH
jgi:anti-sigma factor RsiW